MLWNPILKYVNHYEYTDMNSSPNLNFAVITLYNIMHGVVIFSCCRCLWWC